MKYTKIIEFDYNEKGDTVGEVFGVKPEKSFDAVSNLVDKSDSITEILMEISNDPEFAGGDFMVLAALGVRQIVSALKEQEMKKAMAKGFLSALQEMCGEED
mgnify:CR=1 FL=1